MPHPRRSLSYPVLLGLLLLLGCCAAFFCCGLMPERFALERPELTDISALHEADAANEGKLVFACDRIQEPPALTDKDFGFRCYGLNMKRRVLYYQWAEVNRIAENQVRFDSEETRSATRYERRWVPAPVAAEGFAVQGYHNEVALPTLPDLEAQPTPILNGLALDETLASGQWNAELASLEGYRIPAALAERSSIIGGNTLYVRMHPDSNPEQPEVGDMMIQWLVQPMPAVISLIATQRNGRLTPADKPTGYPPELFELQPTERSFSAANAELNKRGEASDRAVMGAASFLFFLLVYLLRSTFARGFAAVCGSKGMPPQPGCFVSGAATMVLMVICYQAGKFFISPDSAWPYLAVPAVAVFAYIMRQRSRNRQREDATPEVPPPDDTEETPPPPLPSIPEIPREEAPREKRGCGATLSGLALLGLGMGVMYWGERDNTDAARAIDDAKGRILSLDAAGGPRPEAEGQPVCVSGVVETPEVLKDVAFGVEKQAIKLFRHTAVRQWQETVYERVRHRRRHYDTTDDTYTRYEYDYDIVWSPDFIDSSAFHVRKGHSNPLPIAPELTDIRLCTTRATLGGYTLSDAAVAELTGDEELPLPESYRPLPNMAPHTAVRTAGGALELRCNAPSDPGVPASLGDRRFRWSYLPSGRTFTIVAMQQGKQLVPWTQEGKAPLLLVKPGTWTAEEMLGQMEDDRLHGAIGLRVCYIAMLLGGMYLLGMLKPITRRLA